MCRSPLCLPIAKRDSLLEKCAMFREAGGALSRQPSQDNGLDSSFGPGTSKLEQVLLLYGYCIMSNVWLAIMSSLIISTFSVGQTYASRPQRWHGVPQRADWQQPAVRNAEAVLQRSNLCKNPLTSWLHFIHFRLSLAGFPCFSQCTLSVSSRCFPQRKNCANMYTLVLSDSHTHTLTLQ